MNLQAIHALTSFGDRPNDSANEKLNHSLLIYLGLAMSIGGIIWGGICLSYGLNLQASIPLGYAAITMANFIVFGVSKSFSVVRFIQIFISVLLPFVFQWSLGGFIPSGAVMLWAMISLISMITVQSVGQNIFWLVLYIALTIGSGLVDNRLTEFGLGGVDIPTNLRTLFFVLNISIISMFAVGLNIYFVKRHETAQLDMMESEKKLRAIVEYIGKAIINVDQYGEVIFANKGIAKLFGYEEDEIEGMNINQLIRERRRAQTNELMHEDEMYIHYLLMNAKEHAGRHKMGKIFPIKIDLVVMDVNEDEKMYVGVVNAVPLGHH